MPPPPVAPVALDPVSEQPARTSPSASAPVIVTVRVIGFFMVFPFTSGRAGPRSPAARHEAQATHRRPASVRRSH
ncbi:hypothetical protein GCM10027187_28760 [Streptosporangium sandarakinum]